jgi:hypothetical protein
MQARQQRWVTRRWLALGAAGVITRGNEKSRVAGSVLCSAVLCSVAIFGTFATSSAGAAGASVRQCGFVRASVPYSHHGHHDRWRTYVRGAASCTSARSALDAVLHLRATPHYGTDNANSYFTFRSWTCDFGQMGGQSCWRPRHRPYTAGALALDCATAGVGCPARIPRNWVA